MQGNMDAFQNVACPNPGGNQMVNYQDGWHWVVGFSQNVWGKDSVSNVGTQDYVQCFCPLPHSSQAITQGVQTDWQYAGNMSVSEQQQWMNAGWQLRHDGTAFGLPQHDYLVKNYSFSCNGEVSNTSTNGSSQVNQANSATISTVVISNENTGGNNVNKNTGGSATVITGKASSQTDIQNNVNKNVSQGIGQRMRQIIGQIIVKIRGNGALSDNTIHLSSF